MIDTIKCGHCGHPVWDHCAGENCTACESQQPAAVCRTFALIDFTSSLPTFAFEQPALRL